MTGHHTTTGADGGSPPKGLRLTSYGEPALRPRSVADPIQDANDPRWVLAHRTSALLRGGQLPPEAQRQLVALAQRLGLSAFAARLVMAIVQEQARRGFSIQGFPETLLAALARVPRYCPPAAAASLPCPPRAPAKASGQNRLWPAAATAAMVLGAQFLLIWYLWN